MYSRPGWKELTAVMIWWYKKKPIPWTKQNYNVQSDKTHVKILVCSLAKNTSIKTKQSRKSGSVCWVLLNCGSADRGNCIPNFTEIIPLPLQITPKNCEQSLSRPVHFEMLLQIAHLSLANFKISHFWQPCYGCLFLGNEFNFPIAKVQTFLNYQRLSWYFTPRSWQCPP